MVLPEREGWPAHTEGQRYVADRYGVVWLLVPQYDEGMATTSDATGIWSVGINVLQSERGPLRQVWPHATEAMEKAATTISIERPQIHTGPTHLTVDEATVSYLREAEKRVRTNRYWGSGVTALVAGILKAVADEIERTS